jgi:hypothetical protein
MLSYTGIPPKMFIKVCSFFGTSENKEKSRREHLNHHTKYDDL